MLAPPQVARGFLAGIVRKKLKLNLISERRTIVILGNRFRL